MSPGENYVIFMINALADVLIWIRQFLNLKNIERFLSVIFNIIKIIIVLILLVYFLQYIHGLNQWLFDESENGIVIQSFETSGFEKNVSGIAISNLLSYKLLDITDVDNNANIIDVNFNRINLKSKRPYELNVPYLQERNLSTSSGGDDLEEGVASFSLGEDDSDFDFLSLESGSLKYSLSGIGTIGLGGGSLSVGNLLNSMKELYGTQPRTITGCLQRYGSMITLIATLEDHQNNTIAIWKASEASYEKNQTLEDRIAPLIEDLSFQIALDISKKNSSEKNLPETWQALKYINHAQEEYIRFMNTGNVSSLNQARLKALQALSSEPSCNKSLNLLAKISLAYLGKNMPKEAEIIFRNITEFRPVEGHIGLGAVFSKQGKYNESIVEYNEAIRHDPNSALAWNNIGVVFARNEKYNNSIDAYDESLRSDSNYVPAYNNKGYALHQLQNYDSAIKAFDDAIAKDPSNALAMKRKGDALAAQRKYNEAIHAFNGAIKFNPNYAAAWNALGKVYAKMGKPDAAIKAFNDAIRLDSDYVDAWNSKGDLLSKQEKYGEALKVYGISIIVDPSNSIAWNGKGIALAKLNRFEEAIQAYDKVIELDKGYAGAWNNKGIALNELKKYEEAIGAFDMAITLNPNFPEAWYNRGNTLAKLRKYEEALKSYDKAIILDPRYSNAWYSKGKLLAEKSRKIEANEAFNKSEQLINLSNSTIILPQDSGNMTAGIIGK